jgi:hypothetical protein
MSVMTFYVVTETLDVHDPNRRRWSVTTGMESTLTNILDENGYYTTFSCKVRSI